MTMPLIITLKDGQLEIGEGLQDAAIQVLLGTDDEQLSRTTCQQFLTALNARIAA